MFQPLVPKMILPFKLPIPTNKGIIDCSSAPGPEIQSSGDW